MSDPIERQAAIDAMYELMGHWFGSDSEDEKREIKRELDKLPSAQPEIIRRGECKHYDGRPCGIVDWYNTSDDFCSRAERRTE